jgi:hypothetical protein
MLDRLLGFNIGGKQARQKAQLEPVVFVPVQKAFTPMRRVTMLRDVCGWVNNDSTTRRRWHLNTGRSYSLDAEVADEFIVKGYAAGELSRAFSADEKAALRAQETKLVPA